MKICPPIYSNFHSERAMWCPITIFCSPEDSIFRYNSFIQTLVRNDIDMSVTFSDYSLRRKVININFARVAHGPSFLNSMLNFFLYVLKILIKKADRKKRETKCTVRKSFCRVLPDYLIQTAAVKMTYRLSTARKFYSVMNFDFFPILNKLGLDFGFILFWTFFFEEINTVMH